MAKEMCKYAAEFLPWVKQEGIAVGTGQSTWKCEKCPLMAEVTFRYGRAVGVTWDGRGGCVEILNAQTEESDSNTRPPN